MSDLGRLWAKGPTVFRKQGAGGLCYDHDNLLLHEVRIKEIGPIGESNAGEFLVESVCGYTGWVQVLNKNRDSLPACEQCLAGGLTNWVRVELGQSPPPPHSDPSRGWG